MVRGKKKKQKKKNHSKKYQLTTTIAFEISSERDPPQLDAKGEVERICGGPEGVIEYSL